MSETPTRRTMLLTLVLGVLLAMSTACGSKPARPRCERCGMFTDIQPRWTAGAVAADGRDVHFDAPRCMFEWLRSVEGRGGAAPWVTEYYTQRKRPAAFVWYVVGSDVTGPMGPDLVPIGDEAGAQRFLAEHHGRAVLTFDHIGPDTLAPDDAPR